MTLYLPTLIWFLLRGCLGLKITNVTVPFPIMVGESGLLKCEWMAERDKIYTLKWYHGQHEFYRWTPNNENPIQIFPEENTFTVDVPESKRGVVKVKNVTLGATGLFTCEISAEAPAFHTEQKDVNLTVVDHPDTRPIITGGQVQRGIENETIRLNCTSPGSKPAPEIIFTINGEQVPERWLIRYPVYEDPRTELLTKTIGLRFPLLRKYIRKGFVKVICEASLLTGYWEDNERVVYGVVPQEVVMEGLSSASGLRASLGHVPERMTLFCAMFVITFIRLFL